MNIPDLSNLFSGQNIVNFFFKAFAIVFSLMYIIYSLVILKQTQVMTKTLQSSSGSFILLISLIQIGIGIVLLFLSLMLL